MPTIRGIFRLCFRFLWLSAELLLAALTYVQAAALRPGERRPKARALWFQRNCWRLLRVLHVEVDAHGPIPTSGLLVSNHLSYLDILVLGALTPGVFVAKHEVKHWPVFGWFAALAGTIFVNRDRRTQTGKAAQQIETVLERGHLVVLFPEGTSSDGTVVLPFKSSLLEPATKTSSPLSAAALCYEIDDGNVSEEICYWKDMTFFPHLLNLLTQSHITARVLLSAVEGTALGRKALAQQLYSEVCRLKDIELISTARQCARISRTFSLPAFVLRVFRLVMSAATWKRILPPASQSSVEPTPPMHG